MGYVLNPLTVATTIGAGIGGTVLAGSVDLEGKLPWSTGDGETMTTLGVWVPDDPSAPAWAMPDSTRVADIINQPNGAPGSGTLEPRESFRALLDSAALGAIGGVLGAVAGARGGAGSCARTSLRLGLGTATAVLAASIVTGRRDTDADSAGEAGYRIRNQTNDDPEFADSLLVPPPSEAVFENGVFVPR